MLYEEDEFKEVELFSENYTKKIRLFAVVAAQADSFIDLYLETHGKYYVLSFYNNHPETPFIELTEEDDINKLDFHETMKSCRFYKIPKTKQGLSFLNITPAEISSDLFIIQRSQPYDIKDLLNGETCLEIDEKYRLDVDKFNDIKKELINTNQRNNLER